MCVYSMKSLDLKLDQNHQVLSQGQLLENRTSDYKTQIQNYLNLNWWWYY